jgi:PPP family 3-phenylpropionic acid transporter
VGRREVLRLLFPSWVVYGFQFLAIGAWNAYATVYFEELGLPISLIGVLSAVPAAIAILASPAWGLVADRLNDMRPPYLVASIIAASSGFVIAAGLGPAGVLLGVLGLSIGAAGMSPLIDARTVQRLWPHRERFGQARVAGSLAFAAGSFLTGLIVARSGIGSMFLVYGAAMAAAGVAAVLLLGKPGEAGDARRVANVGPLAAIGLLRQPGLGLFLVASAVVWTASTGAMALFSLRILELGGDATVIGIGWAVTALLEAPFMILFPRLARRVAVERLIVIGTLLFVVRSIAWSLAGDPETVIALTVLGSTGYALVLVGTATFVARVAPPHLTATAQALFGFTTFSIGSIAGAVLAGQIAAAFGLWAVVPATAVGGAVGTVMVWLALRQATSAPRGATTPTVNLHPQ